MSQQITGRDTLTEFILKNAERGDCTCGKCIDAGTKILDGHTADVVFFRVRLVGNPSKKDLERLIRSHRGEFADVDILDGAEHSYLEIGAWIGDQGLALTLMGMGSLLGLWELLTPYSIMSDIPTDLVLRMAGSGLITIKV